MVKHRWTIGFPSVFLSLPLPPFSPIVIHLKLQSGLIALWVSYAVVILNFQFTVILGIPFLSSPLLDSLFPRCNIFLFGLFFPTASEERDNGEIIFMSENVFISHLSNNWTSVVFWLRWIFFRNLKAWLHCLRSFPF